MKAILGHTLPPRVIGTIEVSPDGTASTDPPAASEDLERMFMNSARQLAESDGMTDDKLAKMGARDVMIWMLDKMGGRLLWAEPADEEAAKACGRPVYDGNPNAE